MWPFKKKPPPPPPPPIDFRIWNEDWKVGDTAECVTDFNGWHEDMPPWERLPKGSQYTVIGFSDGIAAYSGNRQYFLKLKGVEETYSSTGFRKVIPLKKAEETSIGAKILKATPAPDKTRKADA